MEREHPHRLRRRVYELLDPTLQTAWDRTIHHGLIALVLVNVVAVILESVPSIEEAHRGVFSAIEVVSVVLFTVEYGLRLWTAPEHMLLANRSPWAARLADALTPAGIIDLVAILSFLPALGGDADLRVLSIFRLVRFFKLARYSPGLASLAQAIHVERRALLGCLIILGGLVLTMASIMHLVERAAQPDRFGTIPDAMWWAVITLTTVGYGDVVPVTPLGKVVAGLTAIMGIALIALPVGIIASAFSEVIHQREFVVTWSMLARVPIFSGLDAAAIAEIMQLLHSRTVQKGDLIARRGEQATEMYFIVAGEVEVELKDGENVTLRQGEFFGEIALLTENVRTASVRAREEAHLLVLEAQDLERLMDKVPEIGRRIREVGHARAPDRVDPAENGDEPRGP